VGNATYLETTLTNDIHDKIEKKKFNKCLILPTSGTEIISSTWNLKNLAVCYELDEKSRDWAGRPRNLRSISDIEYEIFHFSSFPEGPWGTSGRLSISRDNLSFKAA
jgi:hypothetical protein